MSIHDIIEFFVILWWWYILHIICTLFIGDNQHQFANGQLIRMAHLCVPIGTRLISMMNGCFLYHFSIYHLYSYHDVLLFYMSALYDSNVYNWHTNIHKYINIFLQNTILNVITNDKYQEIILSPNSFVTVTCLLKRRLLKRRSP